MDSTKFEPVWMKGYQTDTIDNLFDELFPNNVLNTTEIDNLFDDLFNNQERLGLPAALDYLEGNSQESVAKAILFHPTPTEVTFTPEGQTVECIKPLTLFRCIRTAGMPDEFPEIEETCPIEIIETVDNKNYQVHVPATQQLKNGLFGFSSLESSSFKYHFFPVTNIKIRYLKQFLGQILIEKNLIDGQVFQGALQELSSLKQSKLGKILADQTQVNHALLEREIQKIYHDNIKELKVGEILIASGLVNEEQVNKALATQTQLKKKKIGQYLIEKGILKEDEVFMALAEKFRIPYIDLREQSITRKTVDLLPLELIIKLQVLPIRTDDSTLVVATMIPDIPAIKEIIAKHTSHQNIKLVLCRPTLLRAAIKQITQQQATPESQKEQFTSQ